MAWHYKSPSTFPALFWNTIVAAIAQPEELIIFEQFALKENAKAHAERFRYFLWCIRSRPDFSDGMAAQIAPFDLRTKIVEDEVGYILYLRARGDKIKEFETLNPTLAAEIASLL